MLALTGKATSTGTMKLNRKSGSLLPVGGKLSSFRKAPHFFLIAITSQIDKHPKKPSKANLHIVEKQAILKALHYINKEKGI